MKILIVSFFDDNLGDSLIRICFENLLKVVLENLGLQSEIRKMNLKDIHDDWIIESDLICFAGGGLFGLSYLNFYEYLNNIIELAGEKNIPVIFSSMGINNMDADEETELVLRNLLKKKCIKAISVRENIELFKKYIGDDTNKKIDLVCDPVVWCKYIYDEEVSNIEKSNKKVVGINVVRGGLFKDNKRSWRLKDEFRYLNKLRDMLEEEEYDYYFYTNGSFLDNNTLHYYQEQFSIPNEKVIYPHTATDLIKTIAKFDITASIRMHSSIISYGLEIPSTNLLWNDKINFFYQAIGYDENVVDLNDEAPNSVFKIINSFDNKGYNHDKEYLMTIYRYLYNTLYDLLKMDSVKEIYSFDQVKEILKSNSRHDGEDLLDLRFKVEKGEKHYLARFKELKSLEKELKSVKSMISKKDIKLDKNKEEIKKLKNDIKDKENKLNEQNEKINKLNIQLNRYRNFLPIRIARKIRRVFIKIMNRK